MHRHFLLPPLTCLVITLAATPTAVADQTAASTTSVTVEGGGLSIRAPDDAGNLGTKSSGTGAVIISGQLGQVQVIDSRGAPEGAGWTATAISTAFAQNAGPSTGAGSVGYSAGPITKVGAATYTANDPDSLAGVAPVVTATEIAGNNTATWNPTIHIDIDIDIDESTPAGLYVGAITHSVS